MSNATTSPPVRRSDRLPWYSPHSWVLRLSIPLLVIGALVGWVYWSMGVGGPREADRVRHPAGYSIVKPGNWEAKIQTKPSETMRDGITLQPEKWISLEPSIWARRLLWPPDVEKDLLAKGYLEREFQGRKAWVSQQAPRKRVMRIAVFQDGESWYQVGVNLPGLEGTKIDDWWKYALTFQPAAQSAAPTSKPATSGS